MDRPYIVLHLLSSLDSRIDGSFFSSVETAKAFSINQKIRSSYECEAVLNGAVTAAEIYADGFINELRHSDEHFERKDYIAQKCDHYVVCVDIKGSLNWTKNYVERKNMPYSHVIEVLCEDVNDDYIAYLRSLNISYVFAGKENLDLRLLMKKLKELFEINTLMVTGGGVMDYSLLEQGCLDEISLVVAPTVGGERDVATIFDRSLYSVSDHSFDLKLNRVERYDDVLYLNYLVK